MQPDSGRLRNTTAKPPPGWRQSPAVSRGGHRTPHAHQLQRYEPGHIPQSPADALHGPVEGLAEQIAGKKRWLRPLARPFVFLGLEGQLHAAFYALKLVAGGDRPQLEACCPPWGSTKVLPMLDRGGNPGLGQTLPGPGRARVVPRM